MPAPLTAETAESIATTLTALLKPAGFQATLREFHPELPRFSIIPRSFISTDPLAAFAPETRVAQNTLAGIVKLGGAKQNHVEYGPDRTRATLKAPFEAIQAFVAALQENAAEIKPATATITR